MNCISVKCLRRFGVFLASLLFAYGTLDFVRDPAALAAPAADPALIVTYGPGAPTVEGDHDHRVVVRFDLPAGRRGAVYVRLFDPDTAGSHDEIFGRPNTRTRFAIYGAGAVASFGSDETGIYREQVSGTPLFSREFAADTALNNAWMTLAKVDVGDGELVGDRREFYLAVDGVAGNDGNLFNIAISASDTALEDVPGIRLYSFMPTVRVVNRRSITELGFTIPKRARSLNFVNFDTAGGKIDYAGPFRSQPLEASDQDEWRMTNVTLEPDETGRRAAVILAGGTEIPNDISLVIIDDDGSPIPIALPPRSLPPNTRPVVSTSQQALNCETLAFDASHSTDAENAPLAYRWMFHDGTIEAGDRVSHVYSEPGRYPVRLEVRDSSDHIGNGAAQEFLADVKPRPVARIVAAGEIPQGGTAAFDARQSKSPAGLTIKTYSWNFDGKTAGSEPLFSRRFESPGTRSVELSVVEDTDHPCRSASTSATITVDAKPVARAGGDRTVETGDVFVLDGGKSTDIDGNVVSYRWRLPDGRIDNRTRFPYAIFDPGNHRIDLTVTDDSGFDTNVTHDSVVIAVGPKTNIRPTADAGRPVETTVGEIVAFDASASSDEDGSLITYHWDYDNGKGGDGVRASHTFLEPGIYDVRLTVVDDSGAENDVATATRRVIVSPGKNALPGVELPAKRTGFVDEPLTFDASSANDRDGNIVSYGWDFGDGTTAGGALVEHTYVTAGAYTAVLTLRDNSSGLTDFSTREIAVAIGTRGNVPPTADAGSDRTVRVGERVEFDAGGSRDPDGSVSKYAWDFGDGFTSGGIRTGHIYQKPGRYAVSLTVADNAPAEAGRARTEITIVVEPPPNSPPSAEAGPDRLVLVGERIDFDASASRDPDGNILKFEWTFGDGGRAEGRHPVHAYHQPGEYLVNLRVEDDGGDTARTGEDSVKVVVVDEPKTQENAGEVK